MAAYEVLLLNTAIPQIQAAQAGDTYVVPRDIAINATAIISANSATDALRITQTGAGNALVVEDSANPDATPFVVTAAGDVGVGTSSPAYKLDVNGRISYSGAIGEGADTTVSSVSTNLIFGASGTWQTNLFYTNGSERMRIDASGNLGIGTSSPNNKLTVQADATGVAFADNGVAQLIVRGNTNTAKRLGLGIDTTNNVGVIQAQLVGTGNYPLALNPAGGDVGIGTSSPAYKLDVSGQVRALESGTGSGDGGLIGSTGSANGNAGVLFQTNATSRWNLTTQGTNGANLRFYNYALASTVATFDSSGNLGLGVTPSAWWSGRKVFQFGGSGNSSYIASSPGTVNFLELSSNSFINSSVQEIYYATGTSTKYIQVTGAHQWFTAPSGTAGNAITFTQAMTLDASGNLLVGTTSLYNSNSNTGTYSWSAATGSGGEGAFVFVNTSTSTNSDPNPVLILYKSSTTTSSAQRFIQFYADGVTQPMGGIVGNGATNVQFISLSDAREKENVSPVTGALNRVMQLEVVSFDRKGGGDHVKAGFLAQNVLPIYPEYVVENFADAGQDKRYGITGGMSAGYVAELTAALQELKSELDSVKAELAALKGA